MTLDWLKKRQHKIRTTRAISGKEEKKLAKKFNMTKHKNSGASGNYKADLSDNYCIVESKVTNNREQITLHRMDLLKLQVHGSRVDKIPCFSIGFKGEPSNWIMITDADFKMFLELHREKINNDK